MKKFHIRNDIYELDQWLEKRDFSYYTLNYTPQISAVNFLSNHINPIGLIWRQIFRISPLNFRKPLGLSSEIIDPQATIILATAYLELFQVSGELKYKNHFEKCFERVLTLRSNNSNFFAIRQNKQIYLKYYNASYQDIAPILTVWAGELFLNAYNFFKEERYFKLLEEVKNYFVQDLPREEDQDSIYFYYSPKSNFKIWNASCEISSLLIQAGTLLNDEEAILLGKKGINLIVDQQQSNGSWFYGDTGQVTKYVDNFHTGFILKAISNCLAFYSSDKIQNSFELGIKYYKDILFKESKDGKRPRHFDPKYIPKNSNIIQNVDIRDCAMAIILFSEISDKNDDNLNFAREVYNWTRINMKDGETFIGEKTWLWDNKIPYIDFQAWMLLALAKLSKVEKEELC